MTTVHDLDPATLTLLRHAVATLAYRSAKVLRDAPSDFADFHAAEDVRTPLEIVGHMGDLLEWALSIAKGTPTWSNGAPTTWAGECRRYFEALSALDRYLESGQPLHRRPERLIQAPIADALTHTGQLALLRRLAGSPLRGESYYVAPIEIGRVGPDQNPPEMEFDGRPPDGRRPRSSRAGEDR